MRHVEALLDDILKYATLKEELPDFYTLNPDVITVLSIDEMEGLSHFLEMAEDIVIHLWLSHNLSEKIRNRVDDKIQKASWLLTDATLTQDGRYPHRVTKIHQRLERTMLERIMWDPEDADDESWCEEDDF